MRRRFNERIEHDLQVEGRSADDLVVPITHCREGPCNVRFGSFADVCNATNDVR